MTNANSSDLYIFWCSSLNNCAWGSSEKGNHYLPEFPADEVDDADGEVVICCATGDVSIELSPPKKR